MARTKGSKDKETGVRRTSTDAEKNSRKAKKARIAQQNAERAWAAFFTAQHQQTKLPVDQKFSTRKFVRMNATERRSSGKWKLFLMTTMTYKTMVLIMAP
jgi:hypothetical protein